MTQYVIRDWNLEVQLNLIKNIFFLGEFCFNCHNRLQTGTKSVGGEHNGSVHQRQAVPVHRAADDAARPRQPFLPTRVAHHLPGDAGRARHHALQT